MPFPKQKKALGAQPKPASDSKDARFASLSTDPRFRLPSKKHTHTKLDKRFDRILKDDEFSKKASVDRYGRKLEKNAGRKDLERLYQLEDAEEDASAESGEDDVKIKKELKRVAGRYDPARDGGFSESSSEEESEGEESEEEIEEAELYATEEQIANIPTGEVSRRIAVVNMDWDNVRADDIMAVALSFLPADGRIESVTVYPSDFGRERMEREEMEGPPKDIFSAGKGAPKDDEEEVSETEADSEDADDEDEDEKIKKNLLKEDTGEEYNSTALRKYQLDRLRYYYAIIDCSSKVAARSIYDSMDGREYLSSANFFDLRFVPDDVTFDEKPRDTCKDIPRDYKPNEFVTDALRHSKVKLTWDAEDKHRKEVQKRAFSRKDMDDNDLQAYIGSASSESEEDDDDEEIPEGVDIDTMFMTSKSTVNRQARRDAMRAALGLGAEPEPERRKGRKGPEAPVGNMEISFTPGLSASEKPDSVFENDPRDIEESTMERYVRKERERKQRRKEKMKAKREGGEGGDSPDEDAEPTTGAAQNGESDAKDLGFNDPFFMDPLNAEKAQKAAKKKAKDKKHKDAAKDAALSAKQRAELELVMAGDEEQRLKHFDMREIKKAEKAAKLKGKKKKSKKNGDVVEAVQDDFEMNTADPRFARMFESHEFAIDPTNSKYKKTKNMERMRDEGRKKRSNASFDDGKEERGDKRRRSEGEDADVKSMVAKMKRAKKV